MPSLYRRFILGTASIIVSLGLCMLLQPSALAAEGEFSLQVSPSPLVATLKPGQQTTLELKIRNAGIKTEKLKIQPRSFTINNANGQVEFDDTKPPEVADWVRFGAPTFSVEPGQSFDQKVVVDVPKEAGFSYSFALLITRDGNEVVSSAGQQLKGQVAVFTLLNIDRPGAVRQLAIDGIEANQGMYEFLPATINVRLKNTGNTIVQPAGDVFLQRNSDDVKPIDTLAVNKNSGYILPGAVRTLAVQWENGFPVNRTVSDVSGASKQQLDWNWSNMSNFRFGYYTAKVVAVYNDGQRDVPITGEVGFWVIPWRILLGVFVIVGLLGFGVWSLIGRLVRVSRSPNKASKIKRIKH